MHTPDEPAPPTWGTARAFFTFLILDLGFRWLGFQRMTELLMRREPGRKSWPEADGEARARATFRGVQKATMFYYRRRKDCLPKALTTFHLLRRQGIPSSLCYGVKKFPFEAHAWVEAYGTVLDDRPSRIPGYTVIHRVR